METVMSRVSFSILAVVFAIGCGAGNNAPESVDAVDVGPDRANTEDGSPDLGIQDGTGSDADIADLGPLSDWDTGLDGLVPDADAICVPQCAQKECGSDGCEGSCGQCGTGTTCQAGICEAIPCTEGAACDDQDPCTYDDFCTSSVCGGEPYSCDDQQECTKDQCDGLGDCTHTVKPGFCLISNICYANQDPRPGNECEECISSVSKTEWSKDDTNSCFDGNACTAGDHCSSGVCIAGTTATVCPPAGACKTSQCDPIAGCVSTNLGGPCNDGSVCTVGDTCSGGQCLPGTTLVQCDDFNDCTLDGCSPTLGCTHTNLTTACEDGDPCTSGDICSGGACVAGPNGCHCQNTADCAALEDGNKCNGTLICDTSALDPSQWLCVLDPTTVKACTAQFDTPCAKNTCVPQSGLCVFQPRNDGMACDDSIGCTANDTCLAGICSGLDCSDVDLHCINDTCQEQFCLPDSTRCEGNFVMLCNSTGLSEIPSQSCGDTQYCLEDTGGAECVDHVCIPYKLLCDGTQQVVCNEFGSGVSPVQDCAASDQWCLDGLCEKFVICGGTPCPALAGYLVSCNTQQQCEYSNSNTTDYRAHDVWIYVPSGSFPMGSPNDEPGHVEAEYPVHSVTISKGYFFMKYEITVLQYQECVAKNPVYCLAPSTDDWAGNGWGTNTSANGRSFHPQNGLTQQNAMEFCLWFGGGRLPTEAEWEYAATGTSHHLYPWGDSPAATCANNLAVMNELGIAVSQGCSTGGTWPVGSKLAGRSIRGAFDMAGNVWEFVSDNYSDTYYQTSPAVDPTGGTVGYTFISYRGGGFNDPATGFRTAKRGYVYGHLHSADRGARCVRPEAVPKVYAPWTNCAPGSIACIGNKRAQCNAFGSKYIDLEECGQHQTCVAGICTFASCGDSNLDSWEQCDDGNPTLCDGCEECAKRYVIDLSQPYASACTQTAQSPSSAWTVEAWVRFDNLSDTTATYGVVARTTDYPYAETGKLTQEVAAVWVDGAYKMRGRYEDTLNKYHTITGTTAIQQGVWYHVAYTRNSSGSTRLFVNGVQEVTGPADSGLATQAGVTCVGALGNGTSLYKSLQGLLDEVRISNVERYANNFTPVKRHILDNSTKGLWHFDEGLGTTAADSAEGLGSLLKVGGFAWLIQPCYAQ